MFFAKRQIAVFTALAFLGVALLWVETSGKAGLGLASITSRAAGQHRSLPGLKALKRSTFVENAPQPDSTRAARRYYMASRTRSAEIPGARFHPLSVPGAVPISKASTNVFLSVLNL